MKHPELFKYSGDAEDKEWLTKSQVMSTTGGKAYLMVMQVLNRLIFKKMNPEIFVIFCICLFTFSGVEIMVL